MTGQCSHQHRTYLLMKAELRRLHSPDAPDLGSFVPANPENFGLLMQAMIGPKNEKGEESFDFIVCTPGWLSTQLAKSGYLMGRHHLIIDRFNLELIRGAIENLCSQAT